MSKIDLHHRTAAHWFEEDLYLEEFLSAKRRAYLYNLSKSVFAMLLLIMSMCQILAYAYAYCNHVMNPVMLGMAVLTIAMYLLCLYKLWPKKANRRE